MPGSETLLELAARCEAAEGPDRELDTLIHFATNGKWVGRIPTWPPEKIRHSPGEQSMIEGQGYIYGDTVPFLTASIDAAMTLVPEGYAWGVSKEPPVHGGRYHAGVSADAWNSSVSSDYFATPALALCAAALKARAQERGS